MSVRNSYSCKKRYGRKSKAAFNWNIIKAPHAVIDYVVIHELCHLIHANHSDKYWKEVEKHDKERKAHRRWLKENCSQLLPRQQQGG
jgi:predicted metal-dependent hydrolase